MSQLQKLWVVLTRDLNVSKSSASAGLLPFTSSIADMTLAPLTYRLAAKSVNTPRESKPAKREASCSRADSHTFSMCESYTVTALMHVGMPD
ncbi:hypothetical protein [Mycobacteroides abscessus]|uniref:hypothetical protein n=1 Tax=Mycobacteroides abscessus TaxID=36809 RepID=UPI0013F4EC4F|nr:hypothetical protein [Mycobacteroides abscessus]